MCSAIMIVVASLTVEGTSGTIEAPTTAHSSPGPSIGPVEVGWT